MILPNKIIEKLLCSSCGSDNLRVNTENAIQCFDCSYLHPLINGIYSFVSDELREFSEVPIKSREQFIKMKEMTYLKRSVIQGLYTHYHGYARERRKLFGRSDAILDIGFGMGEHYSFIAQEEKDTQAFLGIDLDRFKLELFHQNHPEIPVIQADALNLPFSESSFDIIQLLATLEHFDKNGVNRIIAESLRILRRGGIIITCYPAEGSFLLKSCQRVMHTFLKKKTGFDIENETAHKHSSNARVIKNLLIDFKQMKNIDSLFYPFSVPFLHFSLFVNEVYEKQS